MPTSTTDVRVLDYIRYSAGADRPELSRELDLPLPTVVSSVRRLLAEGHLVAVDTEEGRASRGRGRHLLRASGPRLLLGLIGWRRGRLHTELYDTGRTRLFTSSRDAPEPRSGPEGLVDAVGDLIAAAGHLPASRLATVVVSVPAPFLRGKGAPREHSTLRGLPAGFYVTQAEDFDAYLGRRFGLTFITENDANLAALGEQYARPERIDNFFYLKLGDTGIGSAVVANGRLSRGAHGYGGEIAHLQLDRTGQLCHCGGRGCLWMQVRALTLPDAGGGGAGPIDLAGVAGLAETSDPGAQRMLADIGRLLARPLGQISTVLDPDAIIIDSTIGDAVDHVIGGIREQFALEAPPVIARNVRLEKSSLDDTAEVRGALEIPRETARHP